VTASVAVLASRPASGAGFAHRLVDPHDRGYRVRRRGRAGVQTTSARRESWRYGPDANGYKARTERNDAPSRRKITMPVVAVVGWLIGLPVLLVIVLVVLLVKAIL